MSANQISIIGGDSKFELLAQLADIGRIRPRSTSFGLRIQYLTHNLSLGVYINGIEAEDGSGHRWLIRGTVGGTLPTWLWEFLGSTVDFQAYYDTRTRSGFIEAVPTQ